MIETIKPLNPSPSGWELAKKERRAHLRRLPIVGIAIHLPSKDSSRRIVGTVAENWGVHNVPRLSAAFSFYAILSIAPTLVVVLNVAVRLWGSGEPLRILQHRLSDAIGRESAGSLVDMLNSLNKQQAAGAIASTLGVAVMFFSASNLFLQLNDAMSTIWGVKSDQSFLRSLIVTRLKAFLGVIVFGVLLIGWIALDSWLGWLAHHTQVSHGWRGLSFVVSILFITVVFGVFLKAFPKGQARWSDVWIGAGVTGFAIAVFKLLVSQYVVGVSSTGAYGAAGALVVVLLWIYYTAMMFFVGAEITYAFAHERDSRANLDARAEEA